MNLFIFNESSQAAMYGIGTYIRELTEAIHSDINICVVNLRSDKPQIKKEKINDIQYWHFPAPIPKQQAESYPNPIELYYRNVVYLLRLHVEDRKNLIFHLNYMECKPLVELIKTFFDCKIVLVVHYLDSLRFLSGNNSRLRRIISQTN